MKIAFLTKHRPEAVARIPAGLPHILAWSEDDGSWSSTELAKLADADALLVSAEPVTADVLEAAPKAKIVQRLGVGYNSVDLEAAATRGIPVCNVAGVNKESVAELCLGMMLALAKNLQAADALTRKTAWADARLLTKRSFELQGKTLGIVGFGAVGTTLARLARAFSMPVLYNDIRPIDPALVRELSATFAEKEDLFAQSDIVSINTPLDGSTRGMVDAALLARMKPRALFIMAARGGIVDEAALAQALHQERIGGAAMDVFADEPLAPDNPLRGAPNTLLTAHVAGPTPEASERTWEAALENMRRVVEGGEAPRWVVNGV